MQMPPTPSVQNRPYPCVKCGYDVRGLAAETNCPECGHAVAASLRDDELIHADQWWLYTIGSAVTGFSHGLGVVLLGVGLFIAVLAVPFGMKTPGTEILLVFAGTLTLCSFFFTMICGFVLLWPAPGDAGRDGRGSAQRRAKWAVLTCVGLMLCALLGLLWPPIAVGCGILFPVAFIVSCRALIMVLSDLARRVPLPQLTARLRACAIVLSWMMAVLLAALGTDLIVQDVFRGSRTRLEFFCNIAELVSGLACVAGLVWLAILTQCLRRGISAVIRRRREALAENGG
jgi:hypothetical protein